jgi:hypothetical protein
MEISRLWERYTMIISKKSRNMTLFRLLVIMSTWLSFLPKSYALTPSQICNNSSGSDPDSITLRENWTTINGYRLRIQLRSSNKNTIKWVRACIPAGTVLYLKNASGNTYASYTAGVNGWNFGDKLMTQSPLKACAMYPSYGKEFCTSLG